MSDSGHPSSQVTVSLKQAASCVFKIMKAKRVAMLHGSPGIGKSAIIMELARANNLKLIDLRLAQAEPQDMLGFPQIDMVKMKAGYVPFDTFPMEGEELPVEIDPVTKAVTHRYKGWLLFLDEITSADDDVQAAAYKIVLDGMVGNQKIHKNVAVVAAGNLETDNAIVKPMSTALQTRLVHLLIKPDFREWLSWAMDKQFDFRITSYLQFRPENLYNFDPDHSDLTYACHRTWQFTDELLKVCKGDVLDPDFRPLMSGCVTTGVMMEFLTFCEIHANLPKMADIEFSPLTAIMPEEPGHLFALAGALGNFTTTQNIDKIVQYIVRMPLEFQVVTMRYVMKKGGVTMNNKILADWLEKHVALLF